MHFLSGITLLQYYFPTVGNGRGFKWWRRTELGQGSKNYSQKYNFLDRYRRTLIVETESREEHRGNKLLRKGKPFNIHTPPCNQPSTDGELKWWKRRLRFLRKLSFGIQWNFLLIINRAAAPVSVATGKSINGNEFAPVSGLEAAKFTLSLEETADKEELESEEDGTCVFVSTSA